MGELSVRLGAALFKHQLLYKGDVRMNYKEGSQAPKREWFVPVVATEQRPIFRLHYAVQKVDAIDLPGIQRRHDRLILEAVIQELTSDWEHFFGQLLAGEKEAQKRYLHNYCSHDMQNAYAQLPKPRPTIIGGPLPAIRIRTPTDKPKRTKYVPKGPQARRPGIQRKGKGI